MISWVCVGEGGGKGEGGAEDGGWGKGLLLIILDRGNSLVHAAAGGWTEPPVFMQRKECRVLFRCSMLGPLACPPQQRSGLPIHDKVQSRTAGPGIYENECVGAARGELATTLLLLPGVVPMMLQTPGWDVSIYRITGWKWPLEILTVLFLSRQDCTPRISYCQGWGPNGGGSHRPPGIRWSPTAHRAWHRVVVAGSLCSAPHL